MILYLPHFDPNLPNPIAVTGGDIGHGLCVHRSPWLYLYRWGVSDAVTGLSLAREPSRREAVRVALAQCRLKCREVGVSLDVLLDVQRAKYPRMRREGL